MACVRPPRVTVTIPTYNRASVLPRAIQSVLDQSLADFELFVSDNASEDDTAAAVAAFDDPRIRYLRQDTNTGPHANLSIGLRLGSAPFVTVLQDDDRMLPRNLERKVELLESHGDVGMVDSAARLVVTRDGVPEDDALWSTANSDLLQPGPTVVRQLLTSSFVVGPSPLIRREVVGNERNEEEDGPGTDLGLALRLARRCKTVAYLAEPLIEVMVNEDSDSAGLGLPALIDDRQWGAGVRGNDRHSDGSGVIAAAAIHRNVRRRFLAEHGHEFHDLSKVRAAAGAWTRKELSHGVRRTLSEDRSLGPTLELLAHATRIEPRFALSAEGWKIFLGTVVGGRGRLLAHRIRGRR